MNSQPISHDCEGRPIYEGDQVVFVRTLVPEFKALRNTLVTCAKLGAFFAEQEGEVIIDSELVRKLMDRDTFAVSAVGEQLRKLPPDHLTPCTSDTYSVLTDNIYRAN